MGYREQLNKILDFLTDAIWSRSLRRIKRTKSIKNVFFIDINHWRRKDINIGTADHNKIK